jgi:hypothetical protein
LTLKNIYSRKGGYQNTKFKGNTQKLTKENILSDRVRDHLVKHHTIRANGGEEKIKKIKKMILITVFNIANIAIERIIPEKEVRTVAVSAIYQVTSKVYDVFCAAIEHCVSNARRKNVSGVSVGMKRSGMT